MKTILTALKEQGKTGDTIGRALGGGTIATAIANSADDGTAQDQETTTTDSGTTTTDSGTTQPDPDASTTDPEPTTPDPEANTPDGGTESGSGN